MDIIRTAYFQLSKNFKLTIDSDYVNTMNEYIKTKLIPNQEFIDFTYEDVCGIIKDREQHPRFKEKYTFFLFGKPNYPYDVTIGNFIIDYINDDIWDNYVDDEYSEIIDFDDIYE